MSIDALTEFFTKPEVIALANAIQVLTCLGVFGTIWVMRRDRRRIKIVALNEETNERKLIVVLPAAKVTRGEVLGELRNAAGGERMLKTGMFRFNQFKLGKEVIVPVTKEDFDALQAEGERGKRSEVSATAPEDKPDEPHAPVS